MKYLDIPLTFLLRIERNTIKHPRKQVFKQALTTKTPRASPRGFCFSTPKIHTSTHVQILYTVEVKSFFQELLSTRRGKFWALFFILVLLSLFFQIVHFGEHIIQTVAWIFGYRGAPYVTTTGHYLIQTLGTIAAPTADAARQFLMGNEILHLIGNAIYAFGTVGLLFFIRIKVAITAALIEVFHLYEHISLTLSAAIMSSPIGMSTLWGLTMDPAISVTIRVWWHFSMNAIPTFLSILALYFVYKSVKLKNKKRKDSAIETL